MIPIRRRFARFRACLLICTILISLSHAGAEEPAAVRLTLLGHSTEIALPADDRLDIAVNSGCAGILSVSWPIAGAPVFETPVEPGRNDLSIEVWEDGMSAPDGDYTLTLTLRSGESANTDKKAITVTLKNPGFFPAEWLHIDCAAQPGDIAVYSLTGEGSDIPARGEGQVNLKLITTSRAVQGRTVTVEYYVHGMKRAIRIESPEA